MAESKPKSGRDTLDDRLVEYCGMSQEEINAAMIEFPGLGVIERIRRKSGNDTADQAIYSLSRIESLPIAKAKDLLAADDSLFQEGSVELKRLMNSCCAIPLCKKDKDVYIVMRDPNSKHVKNAFSNFFNSPIKVVLAKESDILTAISQKVGASMPLGQSSINAADSIKKSQNGEASDIFFEFLRTSILDGANTIEIDFGEDEARIVLDLVGERRKKSRISVDPNSFTRVIIENSRVESLREDGFNARLNLALNNESFDAKVEFFHNYKRSIEQKWNTLVLSDFRFNTEYNLSSFLSEQTELSERIKKNLSEKPGIYIISAESENTRNKMISFLQQSFPGCFIVKSVAELSSSPECLVKAKHIPVIVAANSAGLQGTLKEIESIGPEARSLVVGIINRPEGPQNCPFCSVKCVPNPKGMSFLPEQVQKKFGVSWYPRGCPVCEQTGLIGTCRTTTISEMDSTAGDAFRAGKSSDEVFAEFVKSGSQPALLMMLEAAMQGCTNPDSILRFVAGIEDIEISNCFARNNEPIADEKGNSPETGELETSPLLEERDKVKKGNFHSVVLKMDPELLALREDSLSEDKPVEPIKNHAQSGTSTSNAAYHSVVLEMGSDLEAMRKKLLEEE